MAAVAHETGDDGGGADGVAATAAAAATGSQHSAAAAAAAAEAQLTISFRALQRCRTTIEDFCRTYFPLYGLKLPGDLFRFMDVLLYVEATIYQMDEENEAALQQQEQQQEEQQKEQEQEHAKQQHEEQQQQPAGAAAALGSGGGDGGRGEEGAFPAAAALERVLRARGLWDDAIADELVSGYRYWRLERRICAAMARHDLAAGWRRAQAARYAARKRKLRPEGGGEQQKQEGQQEQQEQQEQPPPPPHAAGEQPHPAAAERLPPLPAPPPELGDAGFTPTDALAAHEAKSFDYRVLHRVLVKLLAVRPNDSDRGGGSVGSGSGGGSDVSCGAAPDPQLLEFLRLDERLVDLADDLTDYEDDVVAGGAFNAYRAHLHLYGPGAALALADHIGALEAARARALAKLPAWQRALIEARAAEAAAGRQGADKWVFPPPILNEAGYRRKVLAEEAASAAAAGEDGA